MSLPQETLSRIIHPPAMFQPVLGECRIRESVEDFVVEEIAAYALSGSGEHAFLWLEKRGLAAPELVNRIIRTLGVPSRDVGVAGQKDRHAVTRQYCSIPKRFAQDVERLNSADLQVLNVTYHQNKLKTGHLRGNRFQYDCDRQQASLPTMRPKLPSDCGNWKLRASQTISDHSGLVTMGIR